jgi:hypothetical protein
LVAAALAGCEEDEELAAAAAVRARFGANMDCGSRVKTIGHRTHTPWPDHDQLKTQRPQARSTRKQYNLCGH